jgi:hypothetical protein
MHVVETGATADHRRAEARLNGSRQPSNSDATLRRLELNGTLNPSRFDAALVPRVGFDGFCYR